MQKRNRITRLAVGAVALAVLAGACSDDSDDTTATDEQVTDTSAQVEMETSSTDMSADQSSDTAADAGEAGDIVDTAVAAGEFDTLVAAVQAAGLEETLRGEGPFTVFAPSDAAFDALPAGTVDGLLADPTGALTDILTYHVVEGEVLAEDVATMDGADVTTVNGATFTVAVGEDGSVSLVDAQGGTVGVVQTDIETSNGVIHVIDGVLMP